MTDDHVYTYEYFVQHDVCRLCWNKNADTELFNENATEMSLAEIIKDCIDIEVSAIHPNKLCETCCNEVKRFYSYKKLCQQNNEKFQQIVLEGLIERSNKDDGLSLVKEEINNDNYDEKMDFFNDNEDIDTTTVKPPLTNTKFKKKFMVKVSPTYCSICCIDLESKEDLSSHNSIQHGIEGNGTLFKCFGCEKRFKTKKTRKSHEINFCKGLKDGYKCSLCDRFLPKRSMYEYHMRDHRHNTLTELPEHIFKCKKCSESFNSNKNLKTHMLEHNLQKNYVCDICGRIFTRQDYLHKHKLTHAGIKRHSCPHCDFKAIQRSSLTTHIRKHTGERPYSCDICPQKCISSSNLRAHKRRHLGDKKYECTICSKKFGYKISLEEHISSTHVRSETFPCEHCGATYTRVRGLKRHLAAKHGTQAKNKTGEQKVFTEDTINKVHVEFELKDGENVLLLKHQDNVYIE